VAGQKYAQPPFARVAGWCVAWRLPVLASKHQLCMRCCMLTSVGELPWSAWQA
jgi:hypothetical protein